MGFSRMLWKTGSSLLMRFAFLCVVALAFCACSESGTKPDERLVAAFVEMRAAEQNFGGESPAARLARRDILKKYGYTREEFIEACNKVLDEETSWVPFQLAVSDRMDSLLGIQKAKPASKKDKK